METLGVQMEAWKWKKLAQWKLKFRKDLLLRLPGKVLPQAGSGKKKLKRSLTSSGGAEGKAACHLGVCVSVEMGKGLETPTGDIPW